MRNIVIIVLVIAMFIGSLFIEPVEDTIDVIAGATNDTYNTTLDGTAGASEDEEDEEDEHEDEDEEDEDEEDEDDD